MERLGFNTIGAKVSVVGHVGLIVWMVFGLRLASDPLEFTFPDVSVISGEQFDQMVANSVPQVQTEVGQTEAASSEPVSPTAPVPPTRPDTPPVDAPAPTPSEAVPTPEAAPEAVPTPDLAPQVTQPAVPVPDATPTAPQVAPQVVESQPTPPAPDAGATDAAVAPRPVPRPAQRIAPEAAPAPPVDAQTAPEVQQAVSPDAATPTEVTEAQEQTAPEEATTQTVTEADRPAAAPVNVPRPQNRPRQIATAPTQSETTSTQSSAAATPPQSTAAAPSTSNDDIMAALNAAQDTPAASPTPGAAPLTGAEQDALRVAVQGCWSVDAGAMSGQVTVAVAFELDRSGRVVGNQVRLVESNGSGAAEQAAFEAARRAILRCQGDGYRMPADKYESWQNIVMDFDPSQMRLR
ncbi:putative CheA signal transduction histidine kinase [Ketogulonicigenium robustum]|uniref:Putative CheA signal transduction histidine kinase n=1 Tax=Ketogulonicigenium robustum TaxID=92947 RepID=A0A1W6P0X8_9RHOB|nr:chemotaxis protein CheA [Ketogulonicigenium robustum]ARO15094.1 putative CheA signal transduction histidine kinase [Ketogulonicigenium robustum]